MVMGCGSCGTSKDGKPGGCQSNGGCSSGGCNRLNVHDWLANLPFTDPSISCRIVEVTFNNGSRKEYFRNTTLHHFSKGEMVSVEGASGYDVGMVNLSGELVRMQLKKKRIPEDSADLKKSCAGHQRWISRNGKKTNPKKEKPWPAPVPSPSS